MDGRHQYRGKRSDSKKAMAIDEVYQKIKEMIDHNKLAPGQKLIYSDIARRLNVSLPQCSGTEQIGSLGHG